MQGRSPNIKVTTRLNKVFFWCTPGIMLLLFVANLYGSDGQSSGLSALIIVIGFVFYGYSRSAYHIKRHPIEALIHKDGEYIVFHQMYKLHEESIKLKCDSIYAFNFGYHYLGVIVGNNGKGFDFQYPHKADAIKARLREVLGVERFNEAKINV